MKTSTLIAVVVAGAIAVMILGGIKIWNQGRSPSVSPNPGPTNVSELASSTVGDEPDYAPLRDREPGPAPAPPTKAPVASVPEGVISNAVIAQPGSVIVTNWEERINGLLESDLDDTNIAFRLLALLPNLPLEGKLEATEHLVNLMPDEEYKAVTPLLNDATIDQAVLDVLITDLLLRPESVQLPLFLDMARNPVHPGRTDAIDYLELYLGENYGEDWNAWHAAMVQWLQNNPEE